MPWSKETELDDLSSIDIGIMPLPNDEWSKGKCGLKGLQYMSLGIPTLMSPVGVNNEIIEDGVNGFLCNHIDEWVEKISQLIESPELRHKIGANGKRSVETEYSVNVWKHKYLNYFESLLNEKTALYKKHIDLGAKMVPFAGYEMPVQYAGVNAEHKCVREGVGVFDVSHMGEFLVAGPNALSLIQKISSNDASKLFPGRAQYAYIPNENGGVVDDMIVYMLSENEYMLVVNASNIQKDWDWINMHNDVGAELTNVSDEYSLLAVQGPKAIDLLQELTNENLKDIKFYHFTKGMLGGIDDVIISATGYTGSGGFELYVKNQDSEKLWDVIFQHGDKYDLQPAGLASRDTLRLEMGYCLYGNEIDDTTSPISAGLGWVTKFSKNFLGMEKILSHKEKGTNEKLIAFELLERGIPRKDYEIFNAQDQKVGRVTSGTMSPSTQKAIGLGYVSKNNSDDASLFLELE